jgi:hypothetical protein
MKHLQAASEKGLIYYILLVYNTNNSNTTINITIMSTLPGSTAALNQAEKAKKAAKKSSSIPPITALPSTPMTSKIRPPRKKNATWTVDEMHQLVSLLAQAKVDGMWGDNGLL